MEGWIAGMTVNEDARDAADGGPSLPILLVIWLVCAVLAGLVWGGITSSSPGALSPTFFEFVALGVGFGFGGVGLVWVTGDIIRRP
jgi:hypothetical protein